MRRSANPIQPLQRNEPHALVSAPFFALGIWADETHVHQIRFLPPAPEKETSYLFGFNEKGIYIFPVDGNYTILDFFY